MKHKILLGALCASAAFLSSCSEEDIVKMPHAVGDEIVFSARAGFENADNSSSRTVYSGETYHVDGKTFERIDWVPDIDKVQIYCPQADATKKTVNYTVTGAVTSDNEKSYSTLTKSASEVRGLQWGSDDEHTFYAMYPSTEMLSSAKLDETKLNIHIPFRQNGEIEATATGYIVKPNMSYAYMAAKSSANRTSGDPVNLTFYPMVTTLEITLICGEQSTRLISARITPVKETGINNKYKTDLDNPISGSSSCNMTDWVPGNQIPESSTSFSDDSGCTIEIPLSQETRLNEDQTVTFTTFLHHHKTIKHLELSITTQNTTIKKVLNDINIVPNTKHHVNGLKLTL